MTQSFQKTQRLFLWALTLCFISFCLWAAIAKLDIVQVSHGKLVPTSYVQVAQPSDAGIVRALRVKDGDQVVKGQALVELDAVVAQEDSSSARAQVLNLQHRLARIDAELGGSTLSVPDAGVMAEFYSRKASQQALIDEATRQRESAQADYRTALERMQKYSELLPIASKQMQMLESLRAEGFVSEAALNEKRLLRIEVARDKDIHSRDAKTAAARVSAAEAALTRISADYRRQLAMERTEAELHLQKAQAELTKAEHRAQLQVLRAPVAGTVTGVMVQSNGQVVAAGSRILAIVPAGDVLRFEGWVRNEDSAFVTPGMPSKVKLAAYPFQKYGWLEGEVSWLGVDAETPESMKNAQGEPLFYRVRVAVSNQALTKDGASLPLKPGMQATADLHVGKRTLFEYLTSPLRRVALEAARER